MDTADTGSYDNRMPPAKEIIRRNLKNSPKRRISRPMKSKLRKYCEEHGDICLLPDATEEIHHPLGRRPQTAATHMISFLRAMEDRVALEEEPADFSQHKLFPNTMMTVETWYSEIHRSSSKIQEPAAASREKQLSVIQPPPSREKQLSVTQPAPSREKQLSVTQPAPSREKQLSVTQPAPSREKQFSVIQPAPSREKQISVTQPAPSREKQISVTQPAPSREKQLSVTQPAPSREKQLSVTQLPPVMFPSDLPKAVSSALDKYQKRSERTLTPLAEFSASSRSSLSCSSVSSVEQESLDRVERAVPFSPVDDSDDFDTDCEVEITSDFRALEINEKLMQQDTDIGHITYERICLANHLLPRSQVKRQLWAKKLDLKYAGLLPAEIKAVASSLKRNNRVEDIDLSYNSMTEETATFVIEILQGNTYVTKLNLAGSVLETTGAIACGKLLTYNMSLLHLNLSECSIGDSEVGYLAQGIQVNHVLLQLNLSKNKIGVVGALQLARALGENATLIVIDLSWNHIRGGGAVALGNSLKKNRRLEELDISWNGFGFEGSIAFGETLRVNKTLKTLNMENNRITWDGAPYLAKGLAVNRTLEVLQVGRNPMSMQGCEEILKALAKPTSRVRLLSLKDIPINTKIALKASDIAKYREFTLQHGGILNTRDVIGFQRPRREDPFVLLIRYLSLMGIRVVDLFRMFDKNNDLFITKEKFIQGLQKVRVPLDDGDLLLVAKRLRSNKRGEISYKELASAVRNRIIKSREECKRQEMEEMKKRDERLRILQLDKPLHGTDYISSSYSQYRQHQRYTSPATGDFRRRDSDFASLPPIKNGRNFNLIEMFSGEKRSQNVTRQKTATHTDNAASFSSQAKLRMGSDSEYEQMIAIGKQGSSSSYGAQAKVKHNSNLLRRHKYM